MPSRLQACVFAGGKSFLKKSLDKRKKKRMLGQNRSKKSPLILYKKGFNVKVETIEEFLARGGKIRTYSSSADKYIGKQEHGQHTHYHRINGTDYVGFKYLAKSTSYFLKKKPRRIKQRGV